MKWELRGMEQSWHLKTIPSLQGLKKGTAKIDIRWPGWDEKPAPLCQAYFIATWPQRWQFTAATWKLFVPQFLVPFVHTSTAVGAWGGDETVVCVCVCVCVIVYTLLPANMNTKWPHGQCWRLLLEPSAASPQPPPSFNRQLMCYETLGILRAVCGPRPVFEPSCVLRM